MTAFPLHAKTLAGLEHVLASELTELGAADVQPAHRGVAFVGDQRLMYRANLACRTAIRILKPIARFSATSERALYDGVQQIDWSSHLDVDRSLAIDPSVWSSFCTHSRYVAQLCKDAIVDQFRKHTGRRPSVDRDHPGLRISVHLVQNMATVSLDSSGDSLHRRGYRTQAGEAPLNEVLAAGILRLSDWDRRSTLVDPLCGSGTLCIEAAMLARNMVPGAIRRRFGFKTWKDFDRSLYDKVLAELRRDELPAAPCCLVGSDIDVEAVRMAQSNAERAGVAADVRFETLNLDACRPPTATGTLVANPPYDERLKVAQSAAFYRRIGDVLKQHFAGYTAWIVTGNLEAGKQIGLRPSRKIRVYNGPIECRLLRFDLYQGTRRSPSDAVAAPTSGDAAAAATDAGPEAVVAEAIVAERADPRGATADRNADTAGDSAADQNVASIPDAIDEPTRYDAFCGRSESGARRSGPPSPIAPRWHDQAAMFRNRLARMGKHWRKWARRQGISCFRLYDRDIPDVPLVIDWYEGQLHVAEFARPHDRSAAEHRLWLDFIVRAAAEALGVDPEQQIYLKHRQRQAGKSQYERQNDVGHAFEVHEGGHAFVVNLSDYLDTGLFLDQRQTRAMVQADAAGKRFLNLFGYTGSFTVYAAAGGAAATTTVDLSNTYLGWARRNMQRNGFTDAAHRFIRADATSFLRRHAADGEPPFDLAVVDAPTFSNSKRLEADWDVQRQHVELLELLLAQLTPGGKIYFSTNHRRFKLDEQALRGAALREITAQTIPPDFRNKRVHRCWTLVKS